MQKKKATCVQTEKEKRKNVNLTRHEGARFQKKRFRSTAFLLCRGSHISEGGLLISHTENETTLSINIRITLKSCRVMFGTTKIKYIKQKEMNHTMHILTYDQNI